MEDDQSTTFEQAQQIQNLRQKITEAARGAVKYGHVDRDWVNARLNRMGAEMVTGTAKYQINVPIDGNYGVTVTAGSRKEALEKFNQYVSAVAASGEVRSKHCGEGVYGVTFTDDEPVFYSGPEDIEPSDAPDISLDDLKAAIRQMLKQGVTEQGWGHSHAVASAEDMGLKPLPALTVKTVNVPVSGTTQLNVPVFEGDGDEVVQATVAGVMARTKHVYMQPEEVGMAFLPRPDTSETMGLHIVDEDDDGDVY